VLELSCLRNFKCANIIRSPEQRPLLGKRQRVFRPQRIRGRTTLEPSVC
jgi:hypothetical protein